MQHRGNSEQRRGGHARSARVLAAWHEPRGQRDDAVHRHAGDAEHLGAADVRVVAGDRDDAKLVTEPDHLHWKARSVRRGIQVRVSVSDESHQAHQSHENLIVVEARNRRIQLRDFGLELPPAHCVEGVRVADREVAGEGAEIRAPLVSSELGGCVLLSGATRRQNAQKPYGARRRHKEAWLDDLLGNAR
jgi:hypothetical protein